MFRLVHPINDTSYVVYGGSSTSFAPRQGSMTPIDLSILVLSGKVSFVLLNLGQPCRTLWKAFDYQPMPHTNRTPSMVRCSSDSEAVVEVLHPDLRGPVALDKFGNGKKKSMFVCNNVCLGSQADVNSFFEIFSCGNSAVHKRK